MDAHARGLLDHPGADLEQALAEGRELGPGERHPARHRIAEREHQPVGGGVQDEAELVGQRALAGGPVGGELDAMPLDQVFRLSPRAVGPFVEAAGLAGERGDDVARVEAARRGFGKESDRRYIEKNAIKLLSEYRKNPIDPPSRRWLGRHSCSERIRCSGLWNSDHVSNGYDPEFLDWLEEYVDEACDS